MNSYGPRRAAGALTLIASLALIAALLGGCALIGESQAAASPPATGVASPNVSAAPAPAQATREPLPAMDLSVAVRQVAQQVKPAVVQITNQQVIQPDRFSEPFTVPAGVGSGVIYDQEGHILTNDHVIEGAQELLVTLPDGRSFPARVVGRDPQTDLAVLRIEASDLPIATLGDSQRLQVGDWVVAIGNALGLPGGPTVTSGVVSALGRTVQEPNGPFLFDVIQTDAAINPGNSGGPLVNLAGEVVGINTLVAASSDSGIPTQGIGFAIAISTAKPIADELVASGRVAHPFLGIEYQALTPAIAARLGTPVRSGALVVSVVPGTPAAQAGLRRGDVITAVNDRELQGESALAEALNRHRPGDSLTLTVSRDGETLKMNVTLTERPSQ